MTRIYLDNAATSYPKAPGVGAAAQRFIEEIGSNVNRSGYLGSLAAEETVFATRDLLGELLNFPPRSENVIFTLNVTYGLNFLLKGLLKPGDHCLVSSLEHNAIMRPPCSSLRPEAYSIPASCATARAGLLRDT